MNNPADEVSTIPEFMSGYKERHLFVQALLVRITRSMNHKTPNRQHEKPVDTVYN
jgi:hypothetical protein